jgi:hypothetical protein
MRKEQLFHPDFEATVDLRQPAEGERYITEDLPPRLPFAGRICSLAFSGFRQKGPQVEFL